MQLEKIITLANRKVMLRFLAMERSLRATGCQLPLWVIPYDDDRFDLPANATWWSLPEILSWLDAEKAHPMLRKVQCLTIGNYQYIDTDVIFLRNPGTVLAGETGFVASCGHWRSSGETITVQSETILRNLSTMWQRQVFNAGQFACDRILYTEEGLRQRCSDPRYIETCLRFPYHDQPGLNLLVNLAEIPISNLTLPPCRMESTWAGDYQGADYAAYWKTEATTPYLIHWAGSNSAPSRPIDELIFRHLSAEEGRQLREQIAAAGQRQQAGERSPRARLRKLYHGVKRLTELE